MTWLLSWLQLLDLETFLFIDIGQSTMKKCMKALRKALRVKKAQNVE